MPNIDTDTFQRIQILLAEHATLRNEVIARIGHAHQLLGFGVALFPVLLFQLKPFRFLNDGNIGITKLRKRRILLLSLSVFFTVWFGWGVRSYFRDISYAAARIMEIELDVNHRAQEDLLVWENLWGDAATGLGSFGAPLPRSTLERRPPPVRTFQGKDLGSN